MELALENLRKNMDDFEGAIRAEKRRQTETFENVNGLLHKQSETSILIRNGAKDVRDGLSRGRHDLEAVLKNLEHARALLVLAEIMQNQRIENVDGMLNQLVTSRLLMNDVSRLCHDLSRKIHDLEGKAVALGSLVGSLTGEVLKLEQNQDSIVDAVGSLQNSLASIEAPVLQEQPKVQGLWKFFSMFFQNHSFYRREAAVERLTENLKHTSVALASVKKHLAQRIDEKMKLNEQSEMVRLFRNDVNDIRNNVSGFIHDLEELRSLVCGLNDRLLRFGQKQDALIYACAFLLHLNQLRIRGEAN